VIFDHLYSACGLLGEVDVLQGPIMWRVVNGFGLVSQSRASSLSFKLLELINNSDLSVFRNSTLYVAEDITV
jgi:hypothetical protein